MTEEIINAINEMRRLWIHYTEGWRLVEPHTFGYNSRNNLALSAYQISGESESGESPGWKMFLLERVDDVKKSDQTFVTTRPGYNPEDSRMIRIISGVP